MGIERTAGTVQRRAADRWYRNTAELLRGLRFAHGLTQEEVAARSGVSRAQLSRYERGTLEPSVGTMRRVLGGYGLAPVFGAEPTTAALDERFALAGDDLGLGMDAWLLADRVLWPAIDAGIPLVLGGEFAAGLQGVPLADPECVLHLLLADRERFAVVARDAHCDFGWDLDEQLVVECGLGRIPVLMANPLPGRVLVTVRRHLWGPENPIDVPVVPLADLVSGGGLEPAALALAGRAIERAGGSGSWTAQG